MNKGIDRLIFAPPTSSGEPRDKLAEVSGRRLGELSSQKKVSFLTLLGPPGPERCILAPQTSRGQALRQVGLVSEPRVGKLSQQRKLSFLVSKRRHARGQMFGNEKVNVRASQVLARPIDFNDFLVCSMSEIDPEGQHNRTEILWCYPMLMYPERGLALSTLISSK